MRYFEDFVLGSSLELPERRVSREDILRFAQEFDPLPFHLDEDRARKSHFGGLIASGLHTVCIAACVVVEEILQDSHMAGAAGIDDLRWLHPVRPGDGIRVRFTVAGTEPWKGSGELGMVRARLDIRNHEDTPVMIATVNYLFARRPGSEKTAGDSDQ